jgi:hypothetical protein
LFRRETEDSSQSQVELLRTPTGAIKHSSFNYSYAYSLSGSGLALAQSHTWTSTILNDKAHTTCFQRVLNASARFI